MKFTVAILCSVLLQNVSLGCCFAQTPAPFPATQQVEETLPANASVAIERFRWQYTEKDSDKASAEITVANHSGRRIKRIAFNVIASGKDGLVLVSEGISIRKLMIRATVEPYSSKTFNFDKAFRSEHIEKLELSDVEVEYENGSIDILTP